MKFTIAAVASLLGTTPVHGRRLSKNSNKASGPAKSLKAKSSALVLVANNDNFLFNSHDACSFDYNVLGNDNIASSPSVAVEIMVPPNGGTATVLGNQRIRYERDGDPNCDPDPNDAQVDSLQYRVCDSYSGVCSNIATVIFAVYDSYSGTFAGFDRRQLFELMEEDDFHRHLSKYEEVKTNKLSHCMDPKSLLYGKLSTEGECLHPDNMTNNIEIFHHESKPWAIPTSKDATLLASDPGIWMIDNFVSEEEADKLLALMEKNGYKNGLFGPCRHESQKTNAQQLEQKLCFKISSDNACEGPYKMSKCDAPVDPEDGAFIDALLDRFNSMWSVQFEALPYIKFLHSLGDTPPMDLHLDAKEAISFVLYLSDGGASTLFPFAEDGVATVPKKGSAVTWLNLQSNGSINPKSHHAVQAHPESAGERTIALFQVGTKSFMDMAYA